MLKLPRFSLVKRRLPELARLEAGPAVDAEWDRLGLGAKVAGKEVALALGSRGIDQLKAMARRLVELIRAAGGRPFIVPAMGSHGGATAEGQARVLERLGMDEAGMGCPVLSSMDTVVLGRTPDGLPAYCDRLAAGAGAVLILNRVKAHTSFHGPLESGLHKMLAIGLGKEEGATLLHARGASGLKADMPRVARVVAANLPLAAAFAAVEDGAHRLVRLEAVEPGFLEEREKDLLELAKSLAPSLPLSDIDVLIVDLIGKDFSGTGMDTNVIGRLRIAGEPEPPSPRVKAIVALDLSDASGGNALGIGLADFTVRRLLRKIDFPLTAKNVFTTGFLERGRVPPVYATDREAVEAALAHVFRAQPAGAERARMLRIRNTLELEQLWVSEGALEEVRQSPGFIEAGPLEPLRFTRGRLAG